LENGLKFGVASLALAIGGVAFLDLSKAASNAASPGSATVPEYMVAGHILRLLTPEGACIIELDKPGTSQRSELRLDLRPPCYLLTWRHEPADTGLAAAEMEGTAVGQLGDPMAWRYPQALVVAVIGDPVPESLRSSASYKLRHDQGLHCASSIRGVLIGEEGVWLSKKREHVGIFCAELGLDEKEFWLLAHP